jgi:hypothetical protein
MPTNTEPPWEPYHSQDKQDDDRGYVGHLTLEDTYEARCCLWMKVSNPRRDVS